jgi:hypothetical protein
MREYLNSHHGVYTFGGVFYCIRVHFKKPGGNIQQVPHLASTPWHLWEKYLIKNYFLTNEIGKIKT